VPGIEVEIVNLEALGAKALSQLDEVMLLEKDGRSADDCFAFVDVELRGMQ